MTLTVVYSDKSLDYYQDFYDAFVGDNADFMVATLNFQDYYDHLKVIGEEVETELSNYKLM